MEILALNIRLRTYINYGIIGFIAVFVLLQLIDEALVVILSLLFNIILSKKFGHTRKIILIGIIAWMITTVLFVLQYQYRMRVDWSCIKMISDWEANLSYTSTMILFSMMIWEMEFVMNDKK